jgi:hypothetical protein
MSSNRVCPGYEDHDRDHPAGEFYYAETITSSTWKTFDCLHAMEWDLQLNGCSVA